MRRGLAALAVAALLLSCETKAVSPPLPAPTEEQQKSLYSAPLSVPTTWPTRGWPVAEPTSLRLDPAALNRAADALFVRTGPDAEREGLRTDGLVVVYRDRLVLERYAGGYHPDQRHLWWSVAKSLGNALAGIAVKEGRIRLDDKVSALYPPLRVAGKDQITVDDLLRMSSGLYSTESYEGSPLHSTVNQMLFTVGHRDMGAFAAAQPVSFAPGTVWEYSSLTPNLFSAWLARALGKDYADYPWKKLFEPLGMDSAVLETDAAGTYVLSSYLYATPRDMAKFGSLFLHDGQWEGGRLLPEGWVSYTTTPAPAWLRTPSTPETAGDEAYGAYWWLNRSGPGKPVPWPDVPQDAFAAEGHWGQYVIVIPSRSLVVALASDNRDTGALNLNQFLSRVIAAGAKGASE